MKNWHKSQICNILSLAPNKKEISFLSDSRRNFNSSISISHKHQPNAFEKGSQIQKKTIIQGLQLISVMGYFTLNCLGCLTHLLHGNTRNLTLFGCNAACLSHIKVLKIQFCLCKHLENEQKARFCIT